MSRTIDHRYAPASRWTAICHPDDPHKTLVREDGALLVGFEKIDYTWYFRRVWAFSMQSDSSPLEVTQRTESARIPVVITSVRYPTATLELRAFAHVKSGRRSDIVIWTIRTLGSIDEIITGLHIDPSTSGRVFTPRSVGWGREIFETSLRKLPRTSPSPVDGSPSFVDELDQEDLTLPAPGPLAMVSVPHGLATTSASGFTSTLGLVTPLQVLPGGESMRGALVFPLNHNEVDDIDLAWAEAALESERRFWNGYPLQPLAIEVPDPAVMDMMTASARNILQAREIIDGLPEFRVGAAVYRGLWVVDGHFMLECAQYLGHEGDIHGALAALLRRARPDGSIVEIPFHTKETAIALMTLVRQAELTGDNETLRSAWRTVRAAVHHIESLRSAARCLPEDHPAHGLVPPAFSDGGIAGRRAEYTTTLWALAGLRAIADAALRLNYHEDAECFATVYADLLADFRAKSATHLRHLPDGTCYLPMLAPGSGEHHLLADYPHEVPAWRRVRPETATWALAHAIWPGEILAPDDPIVRGLLALYEARDDEQGIPATTGWLPYRAVWTYNASFAAHVWLYAGRPDKAVDYLYAYANHAAPTRVWREEQSLTSTHAGQIFGDMPHNWASAEFIRLVRHLLVFERGEALELLPGLPPEWVFPGARVRVDRTPTRFGRVTLDLCVSAAGDGTIRLRRQIRADRPLTALTLWLPPGTTSIEGVETAKADGNGPVQVSLPTDQNNLDITFSVHANGGSSVGGLLGGEV